MVELKYFKNECTFKDFRIFVYIHNIKGRKVVKYRIILNHNTNQTDTGFLKFSLLIWLDSVGKVTNSFFHIV